MKVSDAPDMVYRSKRNGFAFTYRVDQFLPTDTKYVRADLHTTRLAFADAAEGCCGGPRPH